MEVSVWAEGTRMGVLGRFVIMGESVFAVSL